MRILRTIILVSMLLVGAINTSLIAPTPQVSAQNCTFTATKDTVILRSGPGREYAEVGRLYNGDTLSVVGRDVGSDLYIWWEGPNDVWVRSDLGDSDCDSLCGDTVCEYGEDAASCPDDCSGITASGGDSCLVPDCQSCYETVDCYPDCNVCTCDANEYGCTTCYCDYSDGSVAASVGTGGGGIVTTYADISCTFTADRVINLRDGPGTEYAIIGEATIDQTISIVARDVGVDTYVWWKTVNNEWVRSDLGESDCSNLCGDGVCEYDEDANTCAADCGTAAATASITSSTSCLLIAVRNATKALIATPPAAIAPAIRTKTVAQPVSARTNHSLIENAGGPRTNRASVYFTHSSPISRRNSPCPFIPSIPVMCPI